MSLANGGSVNVSEPIDKLILKLNRILHEYVENEDHLPELSRQILDCVNVASSPEREHLTPEPTFDLGEDASSSQPSPSQSSEDVTTLGDVSSDPSELTSDESDVLRLLQIGKLKHRELEKRIKPARAVAIRRRYIEGEASVSLDDMPFVDYDYALVNGACCENPIGFMPIPVGVAGPLTINGEQLYIPLATTEGALVASINRGCKVISENGGVVSVVVKDGMTRAPVIAFERLEDAVSLYKWIGVEENFLRLKKAFEDTSNYARLQHIRPNIEGKYVYLRFVATTGDAMGMNMVSKGVQASMKLVKEAHPRGKVLALSGNQCVDKKAAGINWIDGRGKSVIASTTIKASVVEQQLKTTVDTMVDLARAKFLVGTSTVMTIGGWNAQAANIVAAIFLATGQDAAQVVSSAMCLTQMDKTSSGDLDVTCTMKCLEVGTVGGGTILAPQKAALQMLKCCGSNVQQPGENSGRLARIIAAAVVAGEVSLTAALLTDDLVKSHMIMNRSTRDLSTTLSMPPKPTQSLPRSLLLQPPSSTGPQPQQARAPQQMSSLADKTKKYVQKLKHHSDCSNML